MTTDTAPASGRARRRVRTQMAIIAALFGAPILIAWALFAYGWLPSAKSNHGKLIEPPQAMAPGDWSTRTGEGFGRAELLGFWNLLLVVDGRCGEQCMASLDLLRRLRISLGVDARRVHLLLLQPQGAPPADLPDVSDPVVFELLAPARRVAELLARSPGGAEKGVFIIDYRAFNMMTYPVPFDGSGMLEDVEHLLRVSNPQIERNQQQAQDL